MSNVASPIVAEPTGTTTEIDIPVVVPGIENSEIIANTPLSVLNPPEVQQSQSENLEENTTDPTKPMTLQSAIRLIARSRPAPPKSFEELDEEQEEIEKWVNESNSFKNDFSSSYPSKSKSKSWFPHISKGVLNLCTYIIPVIFLLLILVMNYHKMESTDIALFLLYMFTIMTIGGIYHYQYDSFDLQ